MQKKPDMPTYTFIAHYKGGIGTRQVPAPDLKMACHCKNIYRKERELFSRVGYSIPDDVIVITKSSEFPSMYGVVKGLFFLILCFGLLIFSFLISLKSDLT
jgi:hypothetical protein